MGPITITIQKEVPYIIGIVTLLCIACVIIGNKIKKTNPLEKPKGLVMMACWLVELIDNTVTNTVDKKHAKRLAPYIGTIAIYIFVSKIFYMREDIYTLSTNEIVAELGKRFKSYRKKRKMTHKKIAEQTGISTFTLSSFESGRGSGLSLNSFINLLRIIEELERIDDALPELEKSATEQMSDKDDDEIV